MDFIELLTKQYEKYKNKNGRKAKSLWIRIECFKAFDRLHKDIVFKGGGCRAG